MSLPQHEHRAAADEIDAAVRWHEEQEPGLGSTLMDRAEEARRHIAAWPDAAPIFLRADDGTVIRSKAVRGYPYRIIYADMTHGILILAYAHERREPAYWANRMDS